MEKDKHKSVEYQLGFMIGDYIYQKYLPVLDVNSQTNNTIKVSEEDRIKFEKLSNIWFEKYGRGENKDAAKTDWFNLRTFDHYLEKKYLPHTLECYVCHIDVENIEELKLGIHDALWECDVCCYKIEPNDIKIESDKFCISYSIITLMLDMDREIIY